MAVTPEEYAFLSKQVYREDDEELAKGDTVALEGASDSWTVEAIYDDEGLRGEGFYGIAFKRGTDVVLAFRGYNSCWTDADDYSYLTVLDRLPDQYEEAIDFCRRVRGTDLISPPPPDASFSEKLTKFTITKAFTQYPPESGTALLNGVADALSTTQARDLIWNVIFTDIDPALEDRMAEVLIDLLDLAFGNEGTKEDLYRVIGAALSSGLDSLQGDKRKVAYDHIIGSLRTNVTLLEQVGEDLVKSLVETAGGTIEEKVSLLETAAMQARNGTAAEQAEFYNGLNTKINALSDQDRVNTVNSYLGGEAQTKASELAKQILDLAADHDGEADWEASDLYTEVKNAITGDADKAGILTKLGEGIADSAQDLFKLTVRTTLEDVARYKEHVFNIGDVYTIIRDTITDPGSLLTNISRKIRTALDSATDPYKDSAAQFIKDTLNLIVERSEDYKATMGDLFSDLSTLVSDHETILKTAISGAADEQLKPFTGHILNLLSKTNGNIANAEALLADIAGVVTATGDLPSDLLNALKGDAQTGGQNAARFFRSATDLVTGDIEDLATTAASFLGHVKAGVGALDNAGQSLVGFLNDHQGIANDVSKALFRSAFEVLATNASLTKQAVSDHVTEILSDLGQGVACVTGLPQDILTGLINLGGQELSELKKSLYTAIEMLTDNSYPTVLSDNEVASILSKIGDGIQGSVNLIKEMVAAAASDATKAKEVLRSTLQVIIDQLGLTLSSDPADLKAVLEKIGEGIAGINGLASEVIETLVLEVTNAEALFQTAFDGIIDRIKGGQGVAEYVQAFRGTLEASPDLPHALITRLETEVHRQVDFVHTCLEEMVGNSVTYMTDVTNLQALLDSLGTAVGQYASSVVGRVLTDSKDDVQKVKEIVLKGAVAYLNVQEDYAAALVGRICTSVINYFEGTTHKLKTDAEGILAALKTEPLDWNTIKNSIKILVCDGIAGYAQGEELYESIFDNVTNKPALRSQLAEDMIRHLDFVAGELINLDTGIGSCIVNAISASLTDSGADLSSILKDLELLGESGATYKAVVSDIINDLAELAEEPFRESTARLIRDSVQDVSGLAVSVLESVNDTEADATAMISDVVGSLQGYLEQAGANPGKTLASAITDALYSSGNPLGDILAEVAALSDTRLQHLAHDLISNLQPMLTEEYGKQTAQVLKETITLSQVTQDDVTAVVQAIRSDVNTAKDFVQLVISGLDEFRTRHDGDLSDYANKIAEVVRDKVATSELEVKNIFIEGTVSRIASVHVQELLQDVTFNLPDLLDDLPNKDYAIKTTNLMRELVCGNGVALDAAFGAMATGAAFTNLLKDMLGHLKDLNAFTGDYGQATREHIVEYVSEASGVAQGISTWISSTPTDLKELGNDLLSGVLDFEEEASDIGKGFIDTLFSEILKATDSAAKMQSMLDMMQEDIVRIQAIGPELLDKLEDIAENRGEVAKQIAEGTWECIAGSSLLGEKQASIVNIIKDTSGYYQDLKVLLNGDILSNLENLVKDYGAGLFKKWTSAVTKYFGDNLDPFEDILDAVKTAGSLFAFKEKLIGELVLSLSFTGVELVGNLIKCVADNWKNVQNPVDFFTELLGPAAGVLLETLKDGAADLVGVLQDKIGDLIAGIDSAFNGIINLIFGENDHSHVVAINGDITLCGHGMGGALVQMVAAQEGVHGETFSALGVSHLLDDMGLSGAAESYDVQNWVVNGDWIADNSLTQQLGTILMVNSSGSTSVDDDGKHGIDYFIEYFGNYEATYDEASETVTVTTTQSPSSHNLWGETPADLLDDPRITTLVGENAISRIDAYFEDDNQVIISHGIYTQQTADEFFSAGWYDNLEAPHTMVAVSDSQKTYEIELEFHDADVDRTYDYRVLIKDHATGDVSVVSVDEDVDELGSIPCALAKIETTQAASGNEFCGDDVNTIWENYLLPESFHGAMSDSNYPKYMVSLNFYDDVAPSYQDSPSTVIDPFVGLYEDGRHFLVQVIDMDGSDSAIPHDAYSDGYCWGGSSSNDYWSEYYDYLTGGKDRALPSADTVPEWSPNSPDWSSFGDPLLVFPRRSRWVYGTTPAGGDKTCTSIVDERQPWIMAVVGEDSAFIEVEGRLTYGHYKNPWMAYDEPSIIEAYHLYNSTVAEPWDESSFIVLWSNNAGELFVDWPMAGVTRIDVCFRTWLTESMAEWHVLERTDDNVDHDMYRYGESPEYGENQEIGGVDIDTYCLTPLESGTGWLEATIGDPLVLDLNGDGFSTTSLVNGVPFDFDANSVPEQMAWIEDEDGFLVLDRDGSGTIDDGTEFFGTHTVLRDGSQAGSGFEVLADLDTNKSGLFNDRDELFSSVQVWRDLNHDGITTPGELFSLPELGITALSTFGTVIDAPDGKGNTLLQAGTFYRADGTSGEMGTFLLDRDVDLAVAVEYLEVPDDIAALPDVKGSNDVFDLHQAMVRDDTNEIRNLVEQFVAETEPQGREQIVEALLIAWTGTKDVLEGGRGPHFDAEKLEVIEKFFGKQFLNLWGGNPTAEQAVILSQTYQRLTNTVYTLLMSQSHLKELFSLITDFAPSSSGGSPKLDLTPVVAEMTNRLAQDPEGARVILSELARTLRMLEVEGMLVDFQAFRLAFMNVDDSLVWIIDAAGRKHVCGSESDDTLWGAEVDDALTGGAGTDIIDGKQGDDALVGGDGDDLLLGGEGNDILDGGSGTDVLYGDVGDDRYRFGRGWGSDTINDYDYSEGNFDTIEFAAGVTPEDIDVTRDFGDLFLTISDSGEQLDIEGWFYNDAYKIEQIVFADGTVWDVETIQGFVPSTPTEGDDDLYGTLEADTIDALGGNDYVFGDEGDDILSGGEGNDLLIGDWGDDTLYGGAGNDELSGEMGNDILYGEDGADLLRGGLHDDELYGGEGDDLIYGGDGSDTIDGGPGDDELYGDYNVKWWEAVETGHDTYVFGRGSGHDTITDYDPEEGIDTLRIQGVEFWEVTVHRNIWDLYVTINDTGDYVRMVNWFYQDRYKVERIAFDDGTVWDVVALRDKTRVIGTSGDDILYGTTEDDTYEGLSGDDILYGQGGHDALFGGEGNDEVYGGAKEDTLDGGPGNDLLFGDRGLDEQGGLATGPASDTYRFGLGYGHDTIIDSAGNADVVRIVSGVLPADISVTRDLTNLYLTLQHEGQDTGDKLTIQDWFNDTGPTIAQVVFDDGTVWDEETLISLLPSDSTENQDFLMGTNDADSMSGLGGDDYLYGRQGDDTLNGDTGDDHLFGGDGADTLDGGPGDDILDGGVGGDTYLFARGSGRDVISESDASQGVMDTIEVAADLTPADIIVSREGYDLQISIAETCDSLKIENWFKSDAAKVETVVFSDGTSWDVAALKEITQTLGTSEGNTLYGTEAQDTINGLDGNDKIFGYGGDDSLLGGTGNDELEGGEGADTLSGGEGDDVLLGEQGADVLDGGAGGDLLEGGEGDDVLVGGEGHDILRAGPGENTLSGGPGDDTLEGGEQGDTYHFGKGFGTDTIIDTSTTENAIDVIQIVDGVTAQDIRVSRDLDHLYLTIREQGHDTADRLQITDWFVDEGAKIEQVVFADGAPWNPETMESLIPVLPSDSDDFLLGTEHSDHIQSLAGDDFMYGRGGDDHLEGGIGNDQLYGDQGDDLLDGGEGDDILYGGQGNDTYLFGRGTGQDTISDEDATAGNIDTIQVAADVLPEKDVAVTRDRDNLYLTISDTGDFLRLGSWFKSDEAKIEQVVFTDGTVWDAEALRGMVRIVGTEWDDYLAGTSDHDRIDSLAGDDTIMGRAGDDTLYGGSGADRIIASDGADLIDGGPGSDVLQGGTGDDTYQFARGYGHDAIYECDDAEGNIDTIQMAAGISPADIAVSRDMEHLYISIVETSDRITVERWFCDPRHKIEQVIFSDGTTWNSATVESLIPNNATEETDVLFGTSQADSMIGLGGDDFLFGGDGDDLIDGGKDNDELYGQEGSDTLLGAEGADILRGGAGNDTLFGGPGEDKLYGETGADTYQFAWGSGVDTIYENDTTSGVIDCIEILGDLTPADIVLTRDLSRLYVTISASGDRLVVDQWGTNDRFKIEAIRFPDGTFWDLAAINTILSTPREVDDFLVGTVSDDVIDALSGDDTVYGGSGTDTLAGNSGQDKLYGEAGDDTLSGGDGDDVLYGGAGDDTISGGDDQDTLYGSEGADTLDGGLGMDYLLGGAGDDILLGGDDYDTLRGDDGADILDPGTNEGRSELLRERLTGGLGNDTYRFGRGATQVLVEDSDNTPGNVDTIQMGPGLLPDDIKVTRGISGLCLTIIDTGGWLQIRSWYSAEDASIEQVVFADGTVWDAHTLEQLSLLATQGDDFIVAGPGDDTVDGLAGDDTLLGMQGNDTLIGGPGDDTLYGGDGDDTYHFGRGSDTDVVAEYEYRSYASSQAPPTDGFDTVVMADDVSPTDVRVTRTLYNLILTLQDSGDQLILSLWYSDDGYKVEQVLFADGTTWDVALLTDMPECIPTDRADTLFGTTRNNRIDGLAGNDSIYGLGRDDILLGGEGDDKLYGGDGVDTLYGGTGDDTLRGNDGDTWIDGGPGDDSLIGSETKPYSPPESGNDTYFFARGYGHDTITDVDAMPDMVDTVQLAADILPEHIVVYQNTKDLYLIIKNETGQETTDRLSGLGAIERLEFADGTVWDQNELLKRATKVEETYNIPTDEADLLYGTDAPDVIDGLGGDDEIHGGYGNDTLFGGTGADLIHGEWSDDILSGDTGDDSLIGDTGADQLYGGEGDDVLEGGYGDDYLDGGPGNDTLGSPPNKSIAERGNDTYVFGPGYGEDTIFDKYGSEEEIDTILFKEGIEPEYLMVTRDLDNLYIRFQGTTDTLSIYGWFGKTSRIERIEFADGTAWGPEQVEACISTKPTEETDVFFGTDTADTLIGLGGDDYLFGEAGDDQISGDGGSDRLYGGYGKDTILGGDSRDLMWGNEGNDHLTGDEGDDQLYGGDGSDILDGGPGNDHLEGDNSYSSGTRSWYESGNDVYIFGRGYGRDAIVDIDFTEGNIDMIRMNPGVSPDEVLVGRSDGGGTLGDWLHLTISGTEDRLSVLYWFGADCYKVEQVEFADGTVWDVAQLEKLSRQGTDLNNYLVGTQDADILDGLGGNDQIYGVKGDDTLYGGEGADKIYGGEGSDTLSGGDASDELFGEGGDDTLNGGPGDDRLEGGGGSDTYLFERGSGEDTISDYDSTRSISEIDYVLLTGGIIPSDVILTRNVETLYLTVSDTGDRLVFENWYVNDRTRVEQVEFSDGTVWDQEALMMRVGTATVGDDTLVGTPGADAIDSLSGNDHIQGLSGDDSLKGGPGKDAIFGGPGADMLDGGAGNDLLDGGGGSDTFIFGRGSGDDMIVDEDFTATGSDIDSIVLKADITPADIQLIRDYDSLYLRIADTGDTVQLSEWFADERARIEEVRFADGTVWDVFTIRDKMIPKGTDLCDNLYGTPYRDVIDALGGDDTVYALAGDDTISGGTGADMLYGEEGDDILCGGEGNDRLYGGIGEDTLQGGGGDDSLAGEDGRDTLDGGAGDDSLNGGLGNDVYLFGRGYGQDEVYDSDLTEGNIDIVRMAPGTMPEDISVSRGATTDLILRIMSSGDVLSIRQWFDKDRMKIERVEFADGTVWDVAFLEQMANIPTEGADYITGTPGDDVIDLLSGDDRAYGKEGDDDLKGGPGDDWLYGEAGNDRIDGGQGRDRLTGGTGNDTYVFGVGSGNDMLFEESGDADRILFADGITPDDLIVTRGGDALYIRVGETNNQIDIPSWFRGADYRIEYVEFADGTVWDQVMLESRQQIVVTDESETVYGTERDDVINALAGNDSVYGEGGDDILDGGIGNDTLAGGAGDDSYLFGRGSGDDWIWGWDNEEGDMDTIQLADDLLLSDVSVLRNGTDVCIAIQGSDDRLTVRQWFQYDHYRMIRVEFSDGTVWDAATVETLLQLVGGTDSSDTLYGTDQGDTISGLAGNDSIYGEGGDDTLLGGPGDDKLYGKAGDDTLDGEIGNDTMDGGSENDTYLFGRGYGIDTIIDGSGDADRVYMGDNVLPEEIDVRRDITSLFLTIKDTQDVLTINNYFDHWHNAPKRIEYVEFTDGTIWDEAAILGMLPTEPSDEADVFFGSDHADVMFGLGGDDYLFGNTGDDEINGDSGHDRLYGGEGNDTISGGEGNDTLWGELGDDTLIGGEDRDTLYAHEGDDILDGGPGDDSLHGDEGSDTYLFGRGSGHDKITDRGDANDPLVGNTDIIRMAPDILPQDILITSRSMSLLLTISDTGESLQVNNWLQDADYWIEQVLFADGTVWNAVYLDTILTTPSDNNDYLIGTSEDDTIDALGGDDYVYGGGGNDTLFGGAGTDSLYGEEGDDTLDGGDDGDSLYGGTGEDVVQGGLGNDRLFGGPGADMLDGGPGGDWLRGEEGNDTYVFSRGYSSDTVTETSGVLGGVDVIEMALDVLPADIKITRDLNNLYLTIQDTGDRIAISSWFLSCGPLVEQVKFSDSNGTVWTPEDITPVVNRCTDGADFIVGTDGDDVIDVLAGDDILYGRGGNDALNGSEGNDSLYGEDGDDMLSGGPGDDYLVGGQGADIFDGGPGDDDLRGELGSDTYLFGPGSGSDVVVESASEDGDIDTIQVVDGIIPQDVTLWRDYYNLFLTIGESKDQLELRNWFRTPEVCTVEKVVFANGTIWNESFMRANAGMVMIIGNEHSNKLTGYETDDYIRGLDGYDTLRGRDGNDILEGGIGVDALYGEAGNDTLDGGPHTDNLYGGEGDDVYLYGRGSSYDRIRDEGGGFDTIRMVGDIAPEDLKVTRTGEDLILRILDTNEYVTIYQWFSDENDCIEQVEFADGTVWGMEDLEQRSIYVTGTEGDDTLYGDDSDNLMAGLGGNDTLWGRVGSDIMDGGPGDDTLYGEADNDTLDGGQGNDRLDGAKGDDTYLFGRGSGQDTIYDNDTTSGNMDTIQLAEGIAPEDLRVGQNGSNLVFVVPDTQDSLLVERWFSNDRYKIENITFNDGTVWEVADQEKFAVWTMGGRGNDTLYGNNDDNLMDGLSGNDRLYGRAGSDILDGGLGNDSLYGEAGNDTYLFGRGSGVDTVFENDSTLGNIDTVEFEDDIFPNELWITQGGDHIRFVIKDTGDCLSIDRWFTNDRHKVEQVLFADGTVWDVAALMDNVHPIATEGADEIFGTKGDDTFDGLSGDDTIYGRDGSDTLLGSAGNDQLYGEAGNDTLSGGEGRDYLLGGPGEDIMDGGAGNDSLYGEEGNDCYLFGRGSGQDWILDYDETVGNTDIVQFSSDVLPDDVAVSRDFCNLYLTISDTGGRLTVLNYFSHDAYKVERIEFADGTVWDESIIADRTTVEYEAEVEVTMDIPAGWSMISLPVRPEVATVETLFPEAVVVYKYQKGAGYVRVQEGENLEVGKGYWILFDNPQSCPIKGTEISEYARPVEDGWYMIGGCSDQAQRIATSGEIDVIYEYTPGSGYTRVPASQPLAPEKGYWILFSNTCEGEVLWTKAEGLPTIGFSIVGTTGNDLLEGDQQANIIKGFGGHDQLYGGEGDDTLDGGPGNDQLYGEAGNDTYRFERGSGLDTISDYDTSPGNIDTIQLTDDITPADIKVSRDLNNLCLTIVDAAGKSTGDQITVENWFLGEEYWVEEIAFADGTVWDIRGFSPPSPTEAADILYGTIGDDMIDGRGGCDVMYGLEGNDTYHFNPGSGQDTIYDYDDTVGNTDTIQFAEGIAKEEIAIFQNGSNLQIDYGNGDIVTIQNQSDSAHAIEQVETNDGYYLTNEDINTIIQDMTAFATDNGIPFSNVDDVKGNEDLMNIVINGWKYNGF